MRGARVVEGTYGRMNEGKKGGKDERWEGRTVGGKERSKSNGRDEQWAGGMEARRAMNQGWSRGGTDGGRDEEKEGRIDDGREARVVRGTPGYI